MVFESEFDLDYFSQDQHHNWTGLPERSFWNGVVIEGGWIVVSLDPFWLVGARVHKQSFLSQSIVILELVEVDFKSAERAARFQKLATSKESSRNVSRRRALKAFLRQLSSDTCSANRKTEQYVMSN